jgi:hypothetical protein
LIAVAGGATDGTSGVREAADQTIRREIEGFAHVIFGGSAAQREFWLGQKDVAPGEIRARYGGLKPCLHGSDAHKLEDVATPFGDRFSWIKGELEFDALCQACFDPEGRAYVGEQPPRSAMPSQIISHVGIDDADWAATADIPRNHGLVAIIGERGSGKTVLPNVIAAGCDAISSSSWDADENISPSFLARARRLIGDAVTILTWGGGATVTRSLDGRDANGHMSFPRARYLSQQLVEELCSTKGVSDGLVAEIERVIFESHSQDDHEWAIDFAALRDQQTARLKQAREREADAIADISESSRLNSRRKASSPRSRRRSHRRGSWSLITTPTAPNSSSKGPKRRWPATPSSARRLRSCGAKFSPSETSVARSSPCRTRCGAPEPPARRKYSAKPRPGAPTAAWMLSSGTNFC